MLPEAGSRPGRLPRLARTLTVVYPEGALRERTGAKVVGPVPLPTKMERFTVRRSTFIDKDSHEHFEIRTHKRLIDVLEPDSKTIDTLMRLNLPAGGDIEIKI